MEQLHGQRHSSGLRAWEGSAVATEGSAEPGSIDAQMWGEPPTLTASDVAAAIRSDESEVRRVWRLFGLPDPESRVAFFPADIELLRVQADGTEFFGEEHVQHMTRAVGAGTRNIVEATMALFTSAFGDGGDLTPEELEQALSSATVLLRRLIYALPALLVHQAREVSGFQESVGAEQTLTIVFCDLVGSTAMANASPEVTAAAVAEFETQAADAVARRGGRLVKFVGDEVMFATSTDDDARDIAFDVLAWVANHRHLSLARAGLARGRVVARDGDFYGPSVNLAARLVDFAAPDTILVADETGDAVLAVKGFEGEVRVRTSRRV
jgi:adenylate cyclase